uniref:ATP-dependent DNA helicase Q4 n=1 Tax=Glossina austeni TaxID=7395 RepID=A0A1A9UKS1_GLOAU
MEDCTVKLKYQKYKLRVKVWEKEFRKKHGRIPSKYDIKEAPQEIRDSYKMYYKMKTAFLENTLNDTLSDDGFDVLKVSQVDDGLDITLSENSVNVQGPQLPLNFSALVEGCNNFRTIETKPEKDQTKKVSDNATKLNDFKHEFEPVEELSLNDKAWGNEIKEKIELKKKTEAVKKKSLGLNFTQKLFQNSSFSKRNPRKSLSRTILSQNNINDISANNCLNNAGDSLPDLETILVEKAKEQQMAAIIVTPSLAIEKCEDTIKTELDEGWLERTSHQNGLKSLSTPKTEENATQSKSETRPFGLSGIHVKNFSKKSQEEGLATPLNIKESDHLKKLGERKRKRSFDSDYDSIVGDSEDETSLQEHRHIIKRGRVTSTAIPQAMDTKLSSQEGTSRLERNPDHKDFTIDVNKNTGFKEEQPKIERNIIVTGRKPIINKIRLKKEKAQLYSETFKENRDRSKMRRHTLTKLKMESECPNETPHEKLPDPEDLKYALVLEANDIATVPRAKLDDLLVVHKLARKYINNIVPVKNTQSSTIQDESGINEKQVIAQRQLEEKISAGKLNENFVKINIEKKTFVRGKKSINYSRYKKKQWKHKKHIAALAGQDMDMGGCDGGTFKCFVCGQTGHFAQNCKIKGDTLLPLSAQLEEDPSPFPTLKEAERMASQCATAVHSRNISKLPLAANTKIYQEKSFEERMDDKEEGCDSPDNNIDINNQTVSIKPNCLMETDDELESIDFETCIEEFGKSIPPIKQFVGQKIPEEFLKAAGLNSKDLMINQSSSVYSSDNSLYDLEADGQVKNVTPEVLETLRMFGHTTFRKGQAQAIMRILSGLSTLVILSTGSGKSLCYQLPAYMYSRQKNCITLVISPLVSLMEDQVTGVPHFLRAHCLHTNQTRQQKMKTLELISNGEVDILLVSPEAVVAGERSTGFGSILRQLPPIAFACIDEAHCVSQWSHNFRPSYLMICKVLRKNLGVKCILGLTATATLPTRISIVTNLGITDGEQGVISDIPLPNNLILSVSKDENRDHALLELLLSKRFEACYSIIIYCTRRDECERIAAFLRTCLQERSVCQASAKRKRRTIDWFAEPYHAGMAASRRRTIQNAFMNNELRIVVATIAFGMGINKSDIRAVIHYNMPATFENYCQEIGRAGRDNETAHCHLFLDSKGGDKNELRRHIYANSIDRHVIRKLLQRVFVPCSCAGSKSLNSCQGEATEKHSIIKSAQRSCPGHEIGFSIAKTVEALDMPQENISTLLCYMELDNRWRINILSNAFITAKVISYGGAKYLKHAAKKCPPLAMAIAWEIKDGRFKEDSNIIEFSIIDIAAAIGWNSGVVKYQLKNLEWTQVNGLPKRSPITVTFNDLGFRLMAPGDFTTAEIDEALDTLYNRTVKQEKTQLIQLQYVCQGLSSVAYETFKSCFIEQFSGDRCHQLRAIIRNYFKNDYPKDLKLEIEASFSSNDSNSTDEDIINDVNALLSMYPENNFSGRNIARIFHGIPSPNYPAVMWYRCKYWRVHPKADFNRIVQLANTVIVRRRS